MGWVELIQINNFPVKSSCLAAISGYCRRSYSAMHGIAGADSSLTAKAIARGAVARLNGKA
jgi:hypothetical protein